MSLEVDSNKVVFNPGPMDVHAHPRVFDVITLDQFEPLNEDTEGKAGLSIYTAVALQSGITAMLAMPNEHMRLYTPEQPPFTETVPFPISNLTAVRAMESAISSQANIPVGIIQGIDPLEIFKDTEQELLNEEVLHKNFSEAKDDVMALKLYGDETTGGFNVPPKHIPRIAEIWHEHNPEKPIIMHLEDENVGKVLHELYEMPGGKDIPVHIAHVSSRQELEAVMGAKKSGMNVTCEVTPHHLFLDESARDQIGGYGCMKPSLKTKEDIEFIWANMDQVDIFASDCAPHRKSDKEGDNPAYGVTNHILMLKLLLGAVSEGKISYEDVYEKFCVTPRQRFNLPVYDGSETSLYVWDGHHVRSAKEKESKFVGPTYIESPFHRLELQVALLGSLASARGGRSQASETSGRVGMIKSYEHLIRPTR